MNVGTQKNKLAMFTGCEDRFGTVVVVCVAKEYWNFLGVRFWDGRDFY